MTRQLWFERKFQFQLAPENHHDVLARLMATPLQVHAFCKDLDADAATTRTGDAWSIQENVGHLLDLESLWATRTEQLIAGDEVLAAADLENRKSHDADHNQRHISDLVTEFAKARGTWIDRLHGLSAADFAKASRHPRLDQPMRQIDHCVFVAEHDAHHLGRILQLLSQGR
ncbi:MAG: DinB family protein [bacterium]|nr:DinB family protein [bacterium]